MANTRVGLKPGDIRYKVVGWGDSVAMRTLVAIGSDCCAEWRDRFDNVMTLNEPAAVYRADETFLTKLEAVEAMGFKVEELLHK